jgi:hypothetical protein
MQCLAQVVWKGAGIRYNPDRIVEDSPWGVEDSFIHGALFGPGGTCATLPILYTAIGRRLGYPLKLVTAWGPKYYHLFCRWDDPSGERFNVEVNYTGVSFPPDDYYRRHGQAPEMEKAGLFMKSKTPKEELAGFLAQRAYCWRQSGRMKECVDSWAWSVGLSSENAYYLDALKRNYGEWLRQVKAREPQGLPESRLKVVERRYPAGLPLDVEHSIIGLEVTESLLNDHKGDWKGRTPRIVLVESTSDGLQCSFRYSAENCMT